MGDGQKTARELLLAARARLDSPDRWLHGSVDFEAATIDGAGCSYFNEGAVRWDVYGAICLEGIESASSDAVDDALDALSAVVSTPSTSRKSYLVVIDWHDAPERTLADVLHALDSAIGAIAGPPAEPAHR